MADQLDNVVAQVLGIPVERITQEDCPATVESWDSLTHIKLVLALEAEFDVLFSPEDTAELLSVGAIRQMLAAKGVPCSVMREQ
jgi:acyl carrier protein